MPLYTLSTRAPLAPPLRQALARRVTAIHCELTGALPVFVNTLYSHGVPLAAGFDLFVRGSIRQGRGAALKEEMKRALRERLAAEAGLPVARVGVGLFDVPASWVLEGGAIMPEPGEEAEWVRRQGEAGTGAGTA